MNNNETFKTTYSAQQQEEIQAIRDKYLPKEPDKMEQLRALDASVGKKAFIWSLALGIIGALILGFGMSLVMTEMGNALGALALPAGIAVGVIGLVAVALAYPLYRIIESRERAKIAPTILALSDELMK